MADNYLEKRMADYQAGKLGASRSRHSISAPEAPAIHVEGKYCRGIVSALRQLGAKVSFSGLERKDGAHLAQLTGSTYCPMPLSEAIDYMLGVRGSIDALVVVGDCPSDSAFPIKTICYGGSERADAHSISDELPANEAAHLILALAKVSSPLRIEVKSSGK